MNRWTAFVGPVLIAGETANAVVAAIRSFNDNVMTQDRGSYVRVLVPERCVLVREAVERALGRSFWFPGDLEAVMSSFKGKLTLTEGEAVWENVSGRGVV